MLQYLLKFSISLAVLFIFYRVVLRPLTFYQCNRFYLLCYSLLSFVIPFINIAPWLPGSDKNHLVNIIPAINYTIVTNNHLANQPSLLQRVTVTQWLLIVFCVGAITMLIKLIIQYQSLLGIRRRAVLIDSSARVQLYETTAAISPFSFGNAVYFNRQLHTEEELQRIIQHEFVHVQQKHTIDLLVGELLCVVNWFNPFAWLIRHSIRQNLEFIADNNVVANGLDKKEYQYLLLKVVGVPQYSIANNFNFSNLKKRIAMMNKMKTSKLHLAKFLFVLPLMAVLFLAFRKNEQDITGKQATQALNGWPTDTIPAGAPTKFEAIPDVNSKGYIVTIADNNGECVVIVKDKTKKIVKAITLVEWNNDKQQNEKKYGEIPPPPPPPPAPFKAVPDVPETPAVAPVQPAALIKAVDAIPAKPAVSPLFIIDGIEQPGMDMTNASSLPANKIKSMNVLKGNTATVKYGDKGKNGVIEITTKGPLYIVDSVVQPSAFSVETIDPVRIESVHVFKDKHATDKYGDKAIGGAVEIRTKRDTGYFPKGVLVLIDGKEIPAGAKIDDYVKPDNIESMNVLKDIHATEKYGDKGKNGVIEIKTKKVITKNFHRGETMTMVADTIIWHKGHLQITGGNVVMNGQESVINGDVSFGKNYSEMPLVIYNGREITDFASFKITKATFKLLSLEEGPAIEKYGAKAKLGAFEINRL